MTTSIPRTTNADRRASVPFEPSGSGADHPHGPARAVVAVRRLFGTESVDFFLLLGTTLFLVVFGLVMVLSSSSVTSFTETDDFFSQFGRQALFAGLGVPAMLVASRMPVSFWKRWAPVILGLGVVLQFLVVATGLGVDINGNRNWLQVTESLRIQPSEVTKLGLVLWLASVLSSRMHRIDDLRRLWFPLVPVVAIAIGLVLRGHDLGTAMIMMSIVFGVLFFAGVKLRFLVIPVALVALIVGLFTLSTNSRSDRISVWLDQCSNEADFQLLCWQTMHGWWALAEGGVFGVGLGNSKLKWSWLPEADNDFIFAIIGEELGLIGAIVVLALFVVLAISFIRIIRRNTDPFVRLAVSAVLMWVIGQAFVNIAVVLGLLPVLGVPLPLMSAGGTALVTSLFAIGIVLSFARRSVEPDARTADPTFSPVPSRVSARSATRPRRTRSVAADSAPPTAPTPDLADVISTPPTDARSAATASARRAAARASAAARSRSGSGTTRRPGPSA